MNLEDLREDCYSLLKATQKVIKTESNPNNLSVLFNFLSIYQKTTSLIEVSPDYRNIVVQTIKYIEAGRNHKRFSFYRNKNYEELLNLIDKKPKSKVVNTFKQENLKLLTPKAYIKLRGGTKKYLSYKDLNMILEYPFIINVDFLSSCLSFTGVYTEIQKSGGLPIVTPQIIYKWCEDMKIDWKVREIEILANHWRWDGTTPKRELLDSINQQLFEECAFDDYFKEIRERIINN